MRCDEIGVAGIERRVVGADVVEVAHRTAFIDARVDLGARPSSSD
jgi:hypothetical protein